WKDRRTVMASNIDPETLPYRRCVGIMGVNREGLVWAGRRIAPSDSEMAGTDRLWQMPQGGIDKGEEPLPAARRELYAGTGIQSVTLLAQTQGWIGCGLPADKVGVALRGKDRGQTQKWFAFRCEGEDSEIMIVPPPGGHEAELGQWAW